MKKIMFTLAVITLISTTFAGGTYAASQEQLRSYVASHACAGDLISTTTVKAHNELQTYRLFQQKYDLIGIDNEKIESLIQQFRKIAHNPLLRNDEEAMNELFNRFFNFQM